MPHPTTGEQAAGLHHSLWEEAPASFQVRALAGNATPTPGDYPDHSFNGAGIVNGLSPQATPKTLKIVTPKWENGSLAVQSVQRREDHLFILLLMHLLPKTITE